MRANSLPESQKDCVCLPKRISTIQVSVVLESVIYHEEDADAGSLGADAALFIGPIGEKHSRLSHHICQLVRLVSRTGFQAWSIRLTSKTGPQVWSPGLPGFSSLHLISTPSTFWPTSEKRFRFKIACFSFSTLSITNSFERCNNVF